jgi:NAD(P)-dependent dehydrogenase (short-subunit alcohol dehydrogenase family)
LFFPHPVAVRRNAFFFPDDATNMLSTDPSASARNHVVLITGGTSGIGRAMVDAFASEGARIAIAARGVDAGERVVAEVEANGGSARFFPTDISVPEQVEALVSDVADVFGRVDVAVNNAASTEGAGMPTHAFDVDTFDRAVATNLRGVWIGMKHQIRQMLSQDPPGGAIVNVSSINGLGGTPGASIYSACKAGVLALTKSAAQEYASHGIRINALVPGSFDTPMLEKAIDVATAPGGPAEGESREAVREMYGSNSATGRVGQPEEAAQAALWLASETASYVIGHSLIVDGGWTAESR